MSFHCCAGINMVLLYFLVLSATLVNTIIGEETCCFRVDNNTRQIIDYEG